MLKVLLFFVFVNLACAAPLLFVPSLTLRDTDDNYRLTPTDNKYKLVINYGNGFRAETVEEVAPGELLVKGVQDQFFFNHGYLDTTYEAGANGYKAKFQYEWIRSAPTRLPGNFLKSTVAG